MLLLRHGPPVQVTPPAPAAIITAPVAAAPPAAPALAPAPAPAHKASIASAPPRSSSARKWIADEDAHEGDKEKLARFVKDHLRSVTSCYEKELKLKPSLRGKLVVRFVVTPAGRVGSCQIDDDTLHDSSVSGCVVRMIRGWALPFRPDQDTSVSFPFVFQGTG
jgi:hypothetical protein